MLNATIVTRVGTFVVALFAIVFTRAPALIRPLNPLMVRLLRTPLPLGPNVLLEVRGRRIGVMRQSVVACLHLDDRSYVRGASTDVGWTHNLNAAGECVILRRGRRQSLEATELDPEASGRLMRDLLASYPAFADASGDPRTGRPSTDRRAGLFPGPGRRHAR